jgi:hypothetical protein
MPKGDFGDRMPIPNQDSSNPLDSLTKFLIVCAAGGAVFLGAESFSAKEPYTPPPGAEHTEFMKEEPVEEMPEDSILQQTWSMLTEGDRDWLDNLIEGALK